jgi:hypothetical protein
MCPWNVTNKNVTPKISFEDLIQRDTIITEQKPDTMKINVTSVQTFFTH